MSSIGGQRSRIARANFSPSIEPGMSMSVKTMRMSFRASKMAMASSALDTSIALYPAASTKSAACIRLKNSSSTTRTYGCDAGELTSADRSRRPSNGRPSGCLSFEREPTLLKQSAQRSRRSARYEGVRGLRQRCRRDLWAQGS